MSGLALLALAGAVLAVGADLFTDNASALATRLGVRALAVAVLLAGAEPEELVTAAVASSRNRPALAAGDAIGANVTVLTLVLGVALLWRRVCVDRGLVRYSVVALLLAVAAAATVADGRVGRVEGVLLVAAYVPFAVAVWRRERVRLAVTTRATPAPGTPDGDPHALANPSLAGARTVWWRKPQAAPAMALAGVALMTIGGRIAVAGAERVVAALHRSDSAVGLTFVGLATEAELLALVWATVRRHNKELAGAAVIGSVAFNSTLTLGAAALVHPVSGGGFIGAAAVVVALTGALAAITAHRRTEIPPGAGVLLLCAYAAFVAVTLA